MLITRVPGEELFSQVVAGGLVAGWNEYDLFDEALAVSGDFWLGIREFSSTRGIGVDTSSDAGFSQENSTETFYLLQECNDKSIA